MEDAVVVLKNDMIEDLEKVPKKSKVMMIEETVGISFYSLRKR
jgi:hypothetical protein